MGLRIQQLSPLVANQIAAGEVIERPASVVKELLENSLDAQANSISIEIGHGGLNQVKICDNGVGIVAEDLALAIAPHATSKIQRLSDLNSIASMGFRGEALASIASISRLTISSKPPDQEYAMKVSVENSKIDIMPCARSQGTTVDVRDIFFNTPVRKKFLKSEQTEFLAIEMVVKRFALSAPAIAINLNHNGKNHLHLPVANCPQTQLLRIRKLLGKAFIEQAIELDVEHTGLRLCGWFSGKDYQRSQNDKQWIYVNGRMVKDKLLNHALKQAYEGLLYPGRHPACVLYLSINPAEVDVNVHPTKHELRFKEPRLVHDFVYSQIQQAVQGLRLSEHYSVKKNPQLEVRESYQRPSLRPPKSNLFKSESLIILNARYCLFLAEKVFLVDVLELQRHWLLDTLRQQSLPLPSRRLTVPIGYEMTTATKDNFIAYKQALLTVGIDLELSNNNRLLVRSLPLLLAHFNLKSFLAAVFDCSLNIDNDFVELLSLHQSFTAQVATNEEKQILLSYFFSLDQKSEVYKNLFRELSISACRDLLNG